MQKFESHLSKAKNLGSAHSGYHHWLMQRISSVILLALSIWCIYFIINLRCASLEDVVQSATNPENFIPCLLMVCAALYHGSLGVQVIIEDYVSNIFIRNLLIISVRIFSIVTIVSFIYTFILLEFILLKNI